MKSATEFNCFFSPCKSLSLSLSLSLFISSLSLSPFFPYFISYVVFLAFNFSSINKQQQSHHIPIYDTQNRLTHTYTHTHTHTRAHTHVQTHTRTHTSAHTRTDTHTYTHVHLIGNVYNEMKNWCESLTFWLSAFFPFHQIQNFSHWTFKNIFKFWKTLYFNNIVNCHLNFEVIHERVMMFNQIKPFIRSLWCLCTPILT